MGYTSNTQVSREIVSVSTLIVTKVENIKVRLSFMYDMRGKGKSK